MASELHRESSVPDLVPARMLNEVTYCPRLMYLEWVDREWAESAETVAGDREHQRVDRRGGNLPSPDDCEEHFEARSVHLSSPQVGITGAHGLARRG